MHKINMYVNNMQLGTVYMEELYDTQDQFSVIENINKYTSSHRKMLI